MTTSNPNKRSHLQRLVRMVACSAALAACVTPAGPPQQPTRRRDTTRRWDQLVQRAGKPEVPRYLRFRELDPTDRLAVLQTPTLQRGRPGAPLVLRRDRLYLYSVSVDGEFLVGEKAAFGPNAECGHPNLTGGRPARISGELRHDPATGKFVIDNKSGRYGYQISRTRDNLRAASQMLERIGARTPDGARVRLEQRFRTPRDEPRYRLIDCIRPQLRGAPADYDAGAWRAAFIASMGFTLSDEDGHCAAAGVMAARR